MRCKIHILIFIVFLTVTNCYAQEDFEFKRFNIEDGLSHTHVLSINQDTMGYMWIGTYNGLNKFDGHQFITYTHNPDDSTSLPNNIIYDIYVDQEGIVWLGTEFGFCSYNRYTDNFKNFHIKPPKNIVDNYQHIRSIVRDNNGNLWIGTYRNGLLKYNIKGDNYQWFQNDSTDVNSISSNNINNLYFDKEGDLWISHEEGKLSYFNISEMKFTAFPACSEKSGRYLPANEISNKRLDCINENVFTSVHEDENGDFWTSSWHSGIIKHDKNGNVFEYFIPKNQSANNSYMIRIPDLVSYNDKLYAAIFGGGLAILNKSTNKFETYLQYDKSNTSLSQNLVWKVFIDNESNLWVGTFEGGINMTSLKKQESSTFKGFKNQEVKIENVTSITEDINNIVWVGTQESGIFKIDYNAQTIDNIIIDTLPSGINDINSIVQDKDNRIWFGTNLGALKYNPNNNKYTHYSKTRNPNITTDVITSVIADEKGNIWLGTYAKGIIQIPYSETYKDVKDFKAKTYSQNANDSNSLSSDFIEVIFKDFANTIWVGSKGGVDRYNPEIDGFIHMSNSIAYVFQDDSYGNLWYDTYTGPLSEYNREYGQIIPRLTSTPVHSIEEYKGKLWFTSETDVYTYDLTTRETINLTQKALFPGMHFRPNSSVKLKNNTLLFGSSEGLIWFHPDNISIDSKNQQVYIKNIFIHNQPIKINEKIKNTIILDKAPDVEDHIVIPSSVKTFSIEFGSIEFNSPDLESYAFMLEGFDTIWTHTSALNNKATFTNLDGGKYVFKVANTTGKTNWKEGGKTLMISVKPPYYNTSWFKISLLLLIIALVSVTWFIRMANIKKANVYLERQVRLRTSELEERQQQIEEQSEELRIQAESLAESNATKDKLFSIIAHDLKNPFSNLMGFLDLLKINFDKYPPEKTKSIINILFDSTKHIHNLLIGLLDWSMAQQGTISFNPVMADINAIISETINVLKGHASNKNIKINFNSVGDFNVLLDPNLINAVIRNLLSNAIKFTNENGNIKISCINENGNVLVSIVDDGIGMPSKVAENIFKTGIHYSSYGTNDEKGTGLGLNTVKDFIALHKGKVWAESEEGKGSRFCFMLPLTNS